MVNNLKVSSERPKSIFKNYLKDTILYLVSSEYFLKSILILYLQDTFKKYLAQHWQWDNELPRPVFALLYQM